MKSEAISYICGIMDRWKNTARQDIIAHGVCEEYRGLLSRASSKVDALALYKRGINWCLENNSPSIDFLRDYKEDCYFSGIFIDRHFDGEVLIDQPVYVFHNCTGTIRVGLNKSRRTIPMLYFANGCEMDIKGIEGSEISPRVPIYIFGKNRVSAEQSKDITCVIYKHNAK